MARRGLDLVRIKILAKITSSVSWLGKLVKNLDVHAAFMNRPRYCFPAWMRSVLLKPLTRKPPAHAEKGPRRSAEPGDDKDCGKAHQECNAPVA